MDYAALRARSELPKKMVVVGLELEKRNGTTQTTPHIDAGTPECPDRNRAKYSLLHASVRFVFHIRG